MLMWDRMIFGGEICHRPSASCRRISAETSATDPASSSYSWSSNMCLVGSMRWCRNREIVMPRES
jgi:hypothetical protein